MSCTPVDDMIPSANEFLSGAVCQKSQPPAEYDLSAHCTESVQATTGACTGNAVADAIEILNSISGLPKVQLSRLFIYSVCRLLTDDDDNGKADLDRDKGTSIRRAFEVLADFGICREDLSIEEGGWPYDLSLLHRLPSLKAMRVASGHRVFGAYNLAGNRTAQILKALSQSQPVVFSTLVASNFSGLGPDHDPVPPPRSATSTERHAMVVVGYRAQDGFLVKNSWGADWGNDGFCWMTPEYITWDESNSFWVPTRGVDFSV